MKRRTFLTHVMTGLTLSTVSSAEPLLAWQERKYLSLDQALKLVFPTTGSVHKEDFTLSDTQAASVEQIIRLKLSSHAVTVFRGETNGTTDGYALVANEIGKDQYITFIVGISRDFKVQRVALMVFRETRGWEVEDPRFTNQFRGKTAKDRLLIGSDIIGITGATLSSRAFCRGTKKALAVCETLYRK